MKKECIDCGAEMNVRGIRKTTQKRCRSCFSKNYKTRVVSFRNDLSNMVFGQWTIIEYVGNKKWLCRCSCGQESNVMASSLKSGDSTKCHKCADKSRMSDNLIGKVFNNYTVIENVSTDSMKDKWKCVCKCGETSFVDGISLRNDRARYCKNCKNTANIKQGTAFREVLGNYKRGAKKRGFTWELSDDEAKTLFESNCYYTGLPPSNSFKSSNHVYLYNGIDRLDSSKGYSLDNCVPCSAIINKMKMVMGYADFINMCVLVSETYKKTNEQENYLLKLKAV